MIKQFFTFAIITAAVTPAFATVMNNNPLYRPDAGRFYSVTVLKTDTKSDLTHFTATEELGFGITDWLAVSLDTSASFDFDNGGQQHAKWDLLNIALNGRYLDRGPWKADLYARAGQIYQDDRSGFETIAYRYVAGTRAGYLSDEWTLMASAEYHHIKDDIKHIEPFPGFFIPIDFDFWMINFGLDGQYMINDKWNITANVRYWVSDNSGIDEIDDMFGAYDEVNTTVGINYSFDDSKFIGAYVKKSLWADTSDKDTWRFEYGFKFGIDF